MKTTSWRGSLNSRSSEIGLLIVSALAIFLVEQVKWDGVVQRQIGWVVNPVSIQSVQISNLITKPLLNIDSFFSSTGQLQQLKQRHAFLLAELARLEHLEQENEQLKNMLNQKSDNNPEIIIAAPVTSYAYPAVAVGSDQGVMVGQLVMISDNLVGQIVEVESRQARVRLLSEVDSQPLLVETDSGARGLLKGAGNELIITQVLPDDQLITGDKVVTVGQPGFEAGILIGLVGSVEHSLTEPTQQATVDQMVSFYSSPLVSIK